MSQFVVVVETKCTELSYIARFFMENILLKFYLYGMVMIDIGNEFHGIFHKMCSLLSICFYSVAKHNHKAVGIKRFHTFLDNSQRI